MLIIYKKKNRICYWILLVFFFKEILLFDYKRKGIFFYSGDFLFSIRFPFFSNQNNNSCSLIFKYLTFQNGSVRREGVVFTKPVSPRFLNPITVGWGGGPLLPPSVNFPTGHQICCSHR